MTTDPMPDNDTGADIDLRRPYACTCGARASDMGEWRDHAIDAINEGRLGHTLIDGDTPAEVIDAEAAASDYAADAQAVAAAIATASGVAEATVRGILGIRHPDEATP